MTPSPLWHFTCGHGFEGLGQRGRLRPNAHPLLPFPPLVWLTSDPEPERDAVGLTSSLLSCDRMAYRYRVTGTSRCIPWSALRERAAAGVDLESFGDPGTWWISWRPLLAVMDAHERLVARTRAEVDA